MFKKRRFLQRFKFIGDEQSIKDNLNVFVDKLYFDDEA
jgi:hypothetical protein